MQGSTHSRYETRAGRVVSVDRLDAETLMTVLLRNGHRLLAPASDAAWSIGQPVEVLIDRRAPAAAFGLAVRPAAAR